MSTASTIEDVKKQLDQMERDARSAADFMAQMTKLLHERMLKYNWVGFYMLETGAQPPMLAL